MVCSDLFSICNYIASIAACSSKKREQSYHVLVLNLNLPTFCIQELTLAYRPLTYILTSIARYTSTACVFILLGNSDT